MPELSAYLAERIKNTDAVVLGCSAGGFQPVYSLVTSLPADFPVPLIIVMHRGKNYTSHIEELLQQKSEVRVKEAMDKEALEKGTVYFAPRDYHVLVEQDRTISLDISEPVFYCRPAIDVLFESAAEIYKERLLGILLSGANEDGAKGIKAISKNNGVIIIQDPNDAEVPTMPKAAIKLVEPHMLIKSLDIILFFEQIYQLHKL